MPVSPILPKYQNLKFDDIIKQNMMIEDENMKNLSLIAGRTRKNETYPTFTSPYIQQ